MVCAGVAEQVRILITSSVIVSESERSCIDVSVGIIDILHVSKPTAIGCHWQRSLTVYTAHDAIV